MDNEEKIIEDISEETAEAEPEQISAEEERRPVREGEKSSFFYTVICILIFAVLYIGYKTVGFFYNSSSMHILKEMTENERSRAVMLMDTDVPETLDFIGGTLEYRQGKYRTKLAFGLESADEDAAINELEDIIGFEYGDISEEIRISMTDAESFREEKYFGRIYTDIENPEHYAALYKDGDCYCILLVTDKNGTEFRGIFKNGEKI